MKRVILVYGLISGLICSVLMMLSMRLEGKISFESSLFVGYTIIVLSFLLVFFGIRSYRDNVGAGQITFVRGFAVGIAITLVTCVFYVAVWEIVYFNFMPNFMTEYNAHILEKAKAAGKSDAQIQKLAEELRKSKEAYDHVVYNSEVTFLEPFPVGLLMTLLSAAILRKRPKPQQAAAPLTASS
jgi:hypothetical protein